MMRCAAILMLLALPLPNAVSAEELTPVSARVVRYAENPGGLAIGFWANYDRSGNVLRDFGPRPIERVSFHKWSQFETRPGDYARENAFRSEQSAHLAGSTVITNINCFFTHELNPQGMAAIPTFYPQSMDDPATRAAARRFLRAFTRRLLEETGSAWLVLDYEMIWFARPITAQIRQSYRNWFVEAAAICREVASDMGMAERLKVGVIVNTDPYDTAGHSIGSPAAPRHQPQRWLLDCVAAADFVGIDTYAGGATRQVTPDHQLRAIRFWIEHYADDKPVYVTESGFSTAAEHGAAAEGYHIRGTEAEQAAFFERMFQALAGARGVATDPLRKLRGYCVWSYADRADHESPIERHFGLVRPDGSRKPAHAAVAAAIARIESDPHLAPVRSVSSEDVLAKVRVGTAIELSMHDGTNYDVLELGIDPSGRRRLIIELETVRPVCLLARPGDRAWQSTHPQLSTTTRMELSGVFDRPFVLRLRLTGPQAPMTASIQRLRVIGTDP